MPRRPPRLPPLLAEFDDEEREAVLAANRAFYRAFAERDVAGMDQIWAPDRRHGLPASRPGAIAGPRRDHGKLARHPAPSRIAQGALRRRMGGRPAGPRHRRLPRDPARGPAHGDQHLRPPERRLADDRPPLRPGARRSRRDRRRRRRHQPPCRATAASCIRSAFLPSFAGEVSASYADGGVMSDNESVAHDPSAPRPKSLAVRGVREGEEI